MKFTSYFIISTVFYLVYSCNLKTEINEQEIYSIINEIVFDDTIVIDNICCKFDELKLESEELKEFSQDDIQFNEQIKLKFKNLKVKPNKIKYFHLNYKPTDYAKIDSTCSKDYVVRLSLPYISIDRKKILIEIHDDCNCMLGGSGGKYLYEKVNNQWKLKKSFNEWIS